MATYNAIGSNQDSPYGSGDPYYSRSTGYIAPEGYSAQPPPEKKGISKWIKIGIPVAIIVIAAAVLGGVFGSRHTSKSSSGGGNQDPAAAASSAASVKSAVGRYATGTNSKFMVPVYPSTVSSFLLLLYSSR
jgi:hypothetical protein